ncbi:MAG: zinc ribbon domain-containing protein [Candidatus Heimdallarchaeota archaeon]|nr:zinc ribbon domain-containing protein [Candidatus Heimdallarchaeota archaeon]MCK5158477.1 zinc ribbon domain-containing protein [Candidatus Heimdallarchaeota archaeon]
MNQTAFGLIAFFMTLFILGQIKFLIKLRKLRKNSLDLRGDQLVMKAYACFSCGDVLSCCGGFSICCAKTSMDDGPTQYESSRYETKDTGEKIPPKDEKIAEKYRLTKEQKEENKVKVLIHGMPSISIETACKMTKLSKKRVVQIVTNNPNYIIVDDNLVNLKMYSKEEAKELTAILLHKICPNCESPFAPGSEFCPNCGQALK